MTGGAASSSGRTGRNFAAGMSGGVAYVLDLDARRGSTPSSVELRPLRPDDETAIVHDLLERQHVE